MRYLFPTGKGYQRKWLGQDVLSGVVIAAVSIPISMGYAQIAGLPAVYGLYGSLLPVILFALLSTSPQFIFGVDAAPAAMIGGVLGGMGIAMGSAEAERVLTFYVGVWLLLFALLRAGRVLRFVSTSVMGGFISGICCTIILMQLPKLMGGTAGTGELPELVRQSLESYETYFLQNELGWNFSFIPLLVIAAWVSGVVLLATLLLRRQVGVLRGMLALVLVLLYPLAGSLIHIMVAGAAVHDLMIYGLLYALILPLALASFAATHADEMGSLRSALQSLMSWIVIAAMALTAYNYIVTDNKAYLKMALGFTQIEAYSNRLATMIQSVPGYSPSLAVVLVGSSNGDALLDVTPELSEITLTGALNMGTYRTQYSYGNLLNRFSALPNYVYLDDMPEEVSSAIAGVSETMPAYPQEGCVQISGDYIVVRLN